MAWNHSSFICQIVLGYETRSWHIFIPLIGVNVVFQNYVKGHIQNSWSVLVFAGGQRTDGDDHRTSPRGMPLLTLVSASLVKDFVKLKIDFTATIAQ